MGRTLYKIRDWNDHFEVAQSRRDGSNRWVAMPTKHDGKSYRRLMRRQNGPAIYGAWCLIVQVAAKCPTRGILADSDGPLNAQDLEDKTDCPAEVFEQAFKVLMDPKIGWITSEQYKSSQSKSPGALSTEQTEQNRHSSAADKESIPDQIPTSLALETARRVYADLGRKVESINGDDAILRRAAVGVAASMISEAWAIEAAEGVKIKKPKNPCAYFRNSLKAKCEANSVNFATITSLRLDPTWFDAEHTTAVQNRPNGHDFLKRADTNGIATN